jgi:predicted RNA-binding Zn-ribbon protein involved in translation (DUF1610 family)
MITIVFGILFSPTFAGVIFLGISIFYAMSGFNELSESRRRARARQPKQAPIPPTSSAPVTDEPTIAERIKSIHVASEFKCPNCGATVKPTDMKCRHCGSFLVVSVNLPKPRTWADIEIGQSVRVNHPQEGKLTLSVMYRVYYGELWQAQMRKDVPWTLTGNYFVGLSLGKDTYLLNWQSRYYLLDSRSPLTDQDINRDFASHAREFAASNQTRTVRFMYAGAQWQIADIGRFRIEYAEGEGTNAQPGAVGRFIHARAGGRILIVEDYQSGGSGLDTLWLGYEIGEKNIIM